MQSQDKLEAKKIIERLPDNISFEDIQYHLYIAEKLRNARKDIDNGKIFTNEEAKKRLSKWIIK